MITGTTFWQHLSEATTLPVPQHHYLTGDPQQLLRWSSSLSSLSISVQVEQIETVLIELATAGTDDLRRVQLMAIVMTASDRLIAAMHTAPVFDLSTTDGTNDVQEAQSALIAHIKSIHYLSILVYNHIISRQRLQLRARQYRPANTGLRRWFTPATRSSVLLATAIYQSLLIYQKLIYEKDVWYELPPDSLWASLNGLYDTAHRYGLSHLDLRAHVTTRHAPTIHALYAQICLYHLLHAHLMHPSSVASLQRLLPTLAQHVDAAVQPKSATRIFVALHSDLPPQYLSARSSINPYDDDQVCLFFELSPLFKHLTDSITEWQHRDQARDAASVQSGLLSQVRSIINHHYLERPNTIPSKSSPKQSAVLIVGFHAIHYHVAGARNLSSLLALAEPNIQIQPQYKRISERLMTAQTFEVHTFDSTDARASYRAIQMQDELPRPAPFYLFSLVLLCRPNAAPSLTWSIGVVRAINIDCACAEVEWQILAHHLTACGLSLQDKESRNPSVVPALLLSKDEQLQTGASLIVPAYHFRSHDRVTIYLGAQQQVLRLGRCLLQTETFHQFSFSTL